MNRNLIFGVLVIFAVTLLVSSCSPQESPRGRGGLEKGPDITFSGVFYYPQNPEEGDDVTVVYNLTNVGGAVAHDFWVQLNFSDYETEESIYGERHHIESLWPADSVIFEVNTVPLGAGICIVNGTADIFDNVPESNESNNHWFTYIIVEPGETECTDSDGGTEPFVYGWVDYHNQTWFDACNTTAQVNETVCNEQDLPAVVYVKCSDYGNYECSGGKCVRRPGGGSPLMNKLPFNIK